MSDKRIDQTDEYLGGFLDAMKQEEKRKAVLNRKDPTVATRNGVWTTSEHGVPITVTQPSDPAMALLNDDYTTTPVVHDDRCYICEDPEFAQMGLPLCRKCPACQEAGRGNGHIPADDDVCTVCGFNERNAWEEEQINKQVAAEIGVEHVRMSTITLQRLWDNPSINPWASCDLGTHVNIRGRGSSLEDDGDPGEGF